MATRAKFRCDSINLTRALAQTPEFVALLEKLDYQAARVEIQKRGLPETRNCDQPTVELTAVTGGPGESEENKAFWAATPNGRITLSITNPAAAETFELGESYYVTFEAADA